MLLSQATNPFGKVELPAEIQNQYGDGGASSLGKLLNIGVKLLVIGAGIYALINLILAGYAFLSAGDDAKKVAGAWAKITQTIIGLAVAAGAFVLAALFGQLIFGDAGFILNPVIPTL